jgi:hypothetical protein
MRKLLGLLVLSLVLVVGCGQKTEPEVAADAPAVTADLLRLVIIRKEVAGTLEKPRFRGVIRVHNGYQGEITLERVEFSGSAGKHPMPASVSQLDMLVPGGGSAELRLDVLFSWKDDAPMGFERGSLEGTLYYRGPRGKVRQLPFAYDGALDIRGE